MIRPTNNASQSKSSLNISSNNANSTESFPRSILRKTEKRYSSSVDGNSSSQPPLAVNDTYGKHRNAVVIKCSERSLYFEEEVEESDSKILSENEEILIQTSPSSILRSRVVCGAQFPRLNKNNNNTFIRDLNNNDFLEEAKLPLTSREEDIAGVSESKPVSKDDALDDPLILRLQEGLHPTTQDITTSGAENDKAHSSSSAVGALANKTSSHHHHHQQEKKVKQARKGILALPDHLHFKIFSYLNRIDIHTCTQVCRLWKEFCDTLYNSPHVFNGRNAVWCTSQSKQACRNFLNNHLLAADNRRHFKLYFYNTEDWQMKAIAEENAKDFNNAVKHITKLHLVNCNLHWQTLISLLLNLTHLHTFTDTWSCHFQNTSCFPYYRLNTSQGSLKKLDEKIQINELKNKYTRCRVFKLSRKSFTKELCVYFYIVPRLLPFVEEFEFNIGPWKTPKRELSTVLRYLEEFGKIFKSGIKFMRKFMKRLRIYWDDISLDTLFDKCVGAIYTIEFPKLAEFTIRMSETAMKHPGKLPEFVRFINTFDGKDRNKVTKADKLLLKAYVAPIYLTQEWVEFLCTFQDRMHRRKSRVSFRFEVKMDDSMIPSSEKTMIVDTFRNFVFFRGLTKLQVNIHSEQTQSLREVIPGIRATYPNIKSLDIRIGEKETGSSRCFSFRDYSVISIAFNFKFITELRISDQPGRKWDVLDRVLGRKPASLTYAYITARDMVLLCEMLTRLRVLKLWANLNDLRDVNFTGYKQKHFYFRPSDGQYYVYPEITKEKKEPSIYNLKHLQLLSLRGLGKGVTDITCRFAFHGMSHLRYIELTGDTSITQKGRLRLHARMRSNNCKVSFCH